MLPRDEATPQITITNHDQLKRLAESYGIDTGFFSYTGQYSEVPQSTLLKVLAAMDVHVATDEDVARQLHIAEEREWRRILPYCIVARQDHPYNVPIHVPDGSSVTAHLKLETGSSIDLHQLDIYLPPRTIDGKLVGRATFEIPAGLPLGWHTLTACGSDIPDTHIPVAIVPVRLNPPAIDNKRVWGVMAQLYSLSSQRSWGHGDAADLAALGTLSAMHGADFLLINPVHADRPTVPLNPSPYLPYSRQFLNPIYIRPQDVPEAAQLDAQQRRDLDSMIALAKGTNKSTIDRDQSWQWKMKALEMIYRQPRSFVRDSAFHRFRVLGGTRLENFALWCALVEKHGIPLPPEYADINCEAVQSRRHALRDRIDFYMWLQWITYEQLKRAQQAVTDAGASIGIMHDLAVGIDPHGADVWTNPELFAQGIQVGAPADMYNQLGQNWSQPPWRPDALVRSAYEPLRRMVSRLADIGGALRIDHILGLFRLWWIPRGVTPAEGTYVRYDHDAMVGVLLLEAYRAGIVVIGEDLGTVEPGTREYLAQRGILGTGVFWFEYEGDKLRPPETYRTLQLATVNTHDLPPTAGYLHDVHVEIRDRLGLLEEPVDTVLAHSRHERENMADLLFDRGLISQELHDYYYSDASCHYHGVDDSQRTGVITAEQLRHFVTHDVDDIDAMRQTIEALYKNICATPTKMVAVSLVDAVMDIRSQNQPGTYLQYPNWCVPLSDAQGRRIDFEDLLDHPLFERLCQIMNEGVKGTSPVN